MNKAIDCIQTKDEYILKSFPDGEIITVRELQLKILPIMDEIHRICMKHDISYALIAGSALGAFNYKGFIPWDDDIDVCVLKEDWPRFLAAMKTDLSPEFYYQCFDTDKKYNVLIPTMKVRLRGTYIEETNFLLKNRCASGNGVFVDIIIYDSISSHKFVDEFYRTLIRILMLPIVGLDNLGINPLALKKLAMRISKNYSKKYANDEWISQEILIPWEKFLKEPVFRKKDVLPFRPVEFEGRMYYSYNNAETVLRLWYGPNCLRKWDGEKWIEPYPVEKRKPKHIVDLNLHGEMPNKKK